MSGVAEPKTTPWGERDSMLSTPWLGIGLSDRPDEAAVQDLHSVLGWQQPTRERLGEIVGQLAPLSHLRGRTGMDPPSNLTNGE